MLADWAVLFEPVWSAFVIIFEVDIETTSTRLTVKIGGGWSDKTHAAAFVTVIYAFFDTIVVIETTDRTEIFSKVFLLPSIAQPHTSNTLCV